MRIKIFLENTVPLHIESLSRFFSGHCKKLQFSISNLPVRISAEPIDCKTEVDRLIELLRADVEKHDKVLVITAKIFENNYFYSGHRKLTLISFAGWSHLTSLPMSNGLAYMICQILVRYELNIGRRHEINTGCINDFLWDKTGIDVCMRASYICESCKGNNLNNNALLSSEFTEISSILNSISTASRRGIDILSEELLGLATIGANKRVSAFLCHNSTDKPTVRELNEVLKRGGVSTWLDEDMIKPGEVWQDVLEREIQLVGACLVIVGDSALGPWQNMELRAFITEFANRGCVIIPVIIGKPSQVPELPLFLRQFMWADLRANNPRNIASLIAALLAALRD